MLPLVLLSLAFPVMRAMSCVSRARRRDAGVDRFPASASAWRAVCAASNYLALTLYDVLALRHLGRRLPYRQVGFASFVGYAFGR